jgi:nucleotide-binding universal stress UspA family protein
MVYDEVGAWSGRTYPPAAVVVGYNGKQHSRAALAWAAADAAKRDVPLIVLFAANYPGMTVEPKGTFHHRDPGALEAAEEVTAAGVSEALESQTGLRVLGATEVTSPSQALVEASQNADLVVLGSRGHGRIVGTLLGSVSFAVATRAGCPVVVVKDEAAARTVGPQHRVVVGNDGSAESSAAVNFAAARAVAGDAPLEVITCTGGHQVRDVDEAQLRESAQRIAADGAEQVSRAYKSLTVTTRVEDCPPEVTLVDASADAGLVVVGTRGRGVFEGMLLGSVSHAVIHGAASPVAVVGEGQA